MAYDALWKDDNSLVTAELRRTTLLERNLEVIGAKSLNNGSLLQRLNSESE